MKFVIDNIRSDDALSQAKGEAYLAENPDPGVRERPGDMFQRALNTGQALRLTQDGVFQGISLVFQYDPGNSLPLSYEIGTMRVTASGSRLQVFIAQFHLVQIFLEDDMTRGDIFAVVSENTASEHNLTHHVGMSRWTPPDLLGLMRRQQGVPFAPDKLVLHADLAVIRRAFDALRALHIEGNRFRAPKGTAEIEVAMGWFSPDVLQEGP